MDWKNTNAYYRDSFYAFELNPYLLEISGNYFEQRSSRCFRKALVNFSRRFENHRLQLLLQHEFILRECGCWVVLPTPQIFFAFRGDLAHHQKTQAKDNFRFFYCTEFWQPDVCFKRWEHVAASPWHLQHTFKRAFWEENLNKSQLMLPMICFE